MAFIAYLYPNHFMNLLVLLRHRIACLPLQFGAILESFIDGE